MDPEPESLGKTLPLLHIAPDAFLTPVNKRLDTITFDFFLRVDPEFLANFHLHRKAVGIPPGFSFTEFAAHCAIARKEIFDSSGQAVTGMRHPVRRGRAFKKDKSFGSLAFLKRFLVDPILFPEMPDMIFQRWEIDRSFNRLKHGSPSRQPDGCRGGG